MKLVTLAFETSGVDPEKDQILEVGFQVLDFTEKALGASSGVNVFAFLPGDALTKEIENRTERGDFVVEYHSKSGLWDDLKSHGANDVAEVQAAWTQQVVPFIGPQDRPPLVMWSIRMLPFLKGPFEFLVRDLYQRWDFTTLAGWSEKGGIVPRTPERSRAGEKLNVMRELFATWRGIGYPRSGE